MRLQPRRGIAVLGLAALALLLAASNARAGLLQITFHETGFSDVTIIDNMTGDLNPALNQILALVPANFTDYSGSIIASSNNPGLATLGSLGLNPNITAQVAGASPLVITAMQTGFTLPGTPGSTVKFTSTLAVSGLTSGSVGQLGSIDMTSTPPQSLSAPGTNSQSLFYVRGATYSLTEQSTITLTGVGDSTNYSVTDSVAATVPAPPSVIPLITGALGLLGYGWRKRRQGQA
jgi:hypothetical protein